MDTQKSRPTECICATARQKHRKIKRQDGTWAKSCEVCGWIEARTARTCERCGGSGVEPVGRCSRRARSFTGVAGAAGQSLPVWSVPYMPMMFCAHANEMPRGVCSCYRNCGCREKMCVVDQ